MPNDKQRDRNQIVVNLGDGPSGKKAKKALQRAAKAVGKSLSAWVKETLLGVHTTSTSPALSSDGLSLEEWLRTVLESACPPTRITIAQITRGVLGATVHTEYLKPGDNPRDADIAALVRILVASAQRDCDHVVRKPCTYTVAAPFHGGDVGRRYPITLAPRPIGATPTSANAPATRFTTGMREIDRALGGGLARGASLLLVGPRGVGKSTLLSQIADALAAHGNVLYAATEVPTTEVVEAARRIEVTNERVHVLGCEGDTEVRAICDRARVLRAVAVVVDSIHTTRFEGSAGDYGSVAQVRAVASHLVDFAHREGVTVIAVGHLTQDGNVAGGRIVERTFDAVARLESDSDDPDRRSLSIPAVARLAMARGRLVDAPCDV